MAEARTLWRRRRRDRACDRRLFLGRLGDGRQGGDDRRSARPRRRRRGAEGDLRRPGEARSAARRARRAPQDYRFLWPRRPHHEERLGDDARHRRAEPPGRQCLRRQGRRLGQQHAAVRTRRETVTFARPFRLRGVDEAQPAGAYTVETDEEPIEGLSFMAYRRVATVIFLPLARGGPGSFQAVPVDPPALEAAILADKAAG